MSIVSPSSSSSSSSTLSSTANLSRINTIALPSSSSTTTTTTTASLKQLKNSFYLDFSSGSSSAKKDSLRSDFVNLIKASPSFEKILSQVNATTPTPTKVLYPTDVTLAQRQYAQGFLDALNQVQQLNGFVPAPNLLNSPSFLAPLFQSVTSSSLNTDHTKSVSSPSLTTPTREPISVIVKAMNGMSSLSYLAQLTPNQLPYSNQVQCVVPSTSASIIHSPNTSSIKSDTSSITIASKHLESEGSYEMFSNTNYDKNEHEPSSSSINSSASPMSQEEHVNLGPFSSDTYDVTDQERKKLERKRARNRMAATKCRQRKLYKIGELEKQLNDEKTVGSRMNQELSLLEASIVQLKQLLQKHQSHGCVITAKMISS